jgi:hypothetical protein
MQPAKRADKRLARAKVRVRPAPQPRALPKGKHEELPNLLTALLLGAGASRELGMPLRSDVNADILAWLTPASLRKLNTTWRTRGFGHPDEVVEDVAQFLELPDFDYETLLGHLETQYLNDAREGFAHSYHGLYAWLAQMVYLTLFRRQVEHRDACREGLQYFAGIVPLAKTNAPLWIFSLNHDVLVESIAALFGIPVNCGFSPRTVALPCRNASGQPIAKLVGEVIGDADLANGHLPFFPLGSFGINLLKIHGALDVFAWGEGASLHKLKPDEPTFDAIIDAMQIANEGLLDPSLVSSLVPDPLAVMNQIPYLDAADKPQVLRRTLLASVARITDPYPQLMQRRFLEYFRANLGQVDRLVGIGSSLRDTDVQDILAEWLAATNQHELEIVDPGMQQIPTFLTPFSAQVALTPLSATACFERYVQAGKS